MILDIDPNLDPRCTCGEQMAPGQLLGLMHVVEAHAAQQIELPARVRTQCASCSKLFGLFEQDEPGTYMLLQEAPETMLAPIEQQPSRN